MRWVIWGNAGHGLVLSELIEDRGGTVVAIVDRTPGEPIIDGVPLLTGEEDLSRWCETRDERLAGTAAVGGRLGEDRLRIHAVMRRLGIEPTTLVARGAMVSPSATVGDGVQILAGSVVGPRCRVGEGTIVNHGCTVDHETLLGRGVHVSPGATITGLVEIGDFAWIGAGATVLPRIRIGAGSIVGAGAVVTRDVAPGQTVVGVPARPMERPRTGGG